MDHGDTRARIIEAAIEVFLEKGYAMTTVRDICSLAEANVAAVNYHFGSKEALQAAVLEFIMTAHHQLYPMSEGMAEAATPEERLRVIIRNLLRLNFPPDPVEFRRCKLFWMEFGNPSPALTPMVERFMHPIKDSLEQIVRELIGPADEETTRNSVGSVAAQALFHAQNLDIIHQRYPDKTYFPKDVALLADHIFAFSLAGLRAVRDGLDRQGRKQ